MTDHDDITVSHQAGLSRRSLLGGLTATAGAVSLATIAGAHAASAANVPVFAGTPNGEIDALLDPTIAGLVYLPLDAFAFDTATVGATPYRLYQEVTGMQPSSPAEYIYASLPITIGAVVKQINVAYQGQPIISISRRTLGGAFVDVTTPTSLAAGGGAKTQSLNVTADLTAGATYCVRVLCSAGDSTLGMTIGYIPAAQAFIAYTGSQSPRVFDSRPFAEVRRQRGARDRLVNAPDLHGARRSGQPHRRRDGRRRLPRGVHRRHRVAGELQRQLQRPRSIRGQRCAGRNGRGQDQGALRTERQPRHRRRDRIPALASSPPALGTTAPGSAPA